MNILADPFDPLDPGTLEAARKARGITSGAIAKLANCNASTISRIEAGKVDPRVTETWAPIVAAVLSLPLSAA